MSEVYNDPSWNREASRVASELDHNDIYRAQESMRNDMFQLQNDPRAQHEFINMVNRYDQKGVGADINVFRGPDGREQWQITPPNYGDGRYPAPMPAYPIRPEVPVPMPYPVPVQQNPGEALLNGVVTGIGVGAGMGIMRDIFHHRR